MAAAAAAEVLCPGAVRPRGRWGSPWAGAPPSWGDTRDGGARCSSLRLPPAALPFCLVLGSFGGPVGRGGFGRRRWPDPFLPLQDTSIPPAEGRAFRACSLQSLALLRAPTLSQGRPLARQDVSQPWPKGETWRPDRGRPIGVGRDPGPCPKERRPAVAGASPGAGGGTGTRRDFLGSPLHLRQINWSQSQETHRLPGTLRAVRTAVPAPRTHAKQSL